MKTLVVLLQKTADTQSVLSWYVWGGLVLIVIVAWILYARYIKKLKNQKLVEAEVSMESISEFENENKTEEFDVIDESVEVATDAVTQSEPEVVVVKPGPGEYELDSEDVNRFINKLDQRFAVRSTGQKSNDIRFFSTSWPHLFSKETFKSIVTEIPGLDFCEDNAEHHIKMSKSPACKWSDLQDEILKFIFRQLHRNYDWKLLPQTVIVQQSRGNSNVLMFHLRVETYKHLDLGRLLLNVPGITRQVSTENEFPSLMDSIGRYQFSLSKGEAYTWDELFPQVREVFENYFPAGVTFSGEDWDRILLKDMVKHVMS